MTEDDQSERKLLVAAPRRGAPNQRPTGEAALQRAGVIAYAGIGLFFLFTASIMTLIEYKGVSMPASVISRTEESNDESPSYRVDFRYQYGDVIYYGESNITKK